MKSSITLAFIILIQIVGATELTLDNYLSSPMFGGLVSLTILTLVVIPVVYMFREERGIKNG